jgi:hypothetical protein
MDAQHAWRGETVKETEVRKNPGCDRPADRQPASVLLTQRDRSYAFSTFRTFLSNSWGDAGLAMNCRP